MSNRYKMFFHCRSCVEEMPSGQSPETWARLSVGWTDDNAILVWCVRHDKRVTEIPIDDQPPVIEAAGTMQ